VLRLLRGARACCQRAQQRAAGASAGGARLDGGVAVLERLGRRALRGRNGGTIGAIQNNR
jgi:hypothetical protein